MTIRSISFDDDDNTDELFVFSGSDLLTAHYDRSDLDWQEVAERTLIDERRGLVITQVAVLEDLIDEFILYLTDPAPVGHDEVLSGMIGARLDRLTRLLKGAGLFGETERDLLTEVRTVVKRRNQLAHGNIAWQPVPWKSVKEISAGGDLTMQWLLVDRRSGSDGREPISMALLRQDVHDAAQAFLGLLAYAERFVERAPWPRNFEGGHYLGRPTP